MDLARFVSLHPRFSQRSQKNGGNRDRVGQAESRKRRGTIFILVSSLLVGCEQEWARETLHHEALPMKDCIQFRPLTDEDMAPEFCPLCRTGEIIFIYSTSPGDAGQRDASRADEGCCCLQCGQRLLATMEEVVLARWQVEPAKAPERAAR